MKRVKKKGRPSFSKPGCISFLRLHMTSRSRCQCKAAFHTFTLSIHIPSVICSSVPTSSLLSQREGGRKERGSGWIVWHRSSECQGLVMNEKGCRRRYAYPLGRGQHYSSEVPTSSVLPQIIVKS